MDLEGETEYHPCIGRNRFLTEVYNSCSVTWRNELYIFGGRHRKQSISKLNGLRLDYLGNLEFDHSFGACSVMNDQFIFLCFNDNYNGDDWKRCRRSTGPMETFTEIAFTQYEHRTTSTSSSDSKSFRLMTNQIIVFFSCTSSGRIPQCKYCSDT